MHGIAQNPGTKDYIMVLENCMECGEEYTNTTLKWCKPCHMKNANTTSSKNEKIDDLVQEMQLKISTYYYIGFEWILFNKFNNIKEISKDDVAILYSAIWEDGPLNYCDKKWIRDADTKVTLKCLLDSSSTTNKLLNEV
jgi:hypothetical protein